MRLCHHVGNILSSNLLLLSGFGMIASTQHSTRVGPFQLCRFWRVFIKLALVQHTDCTCHITQYAGLIIAPVAVLFMVYALFMYKKRTIQILLKQKNVRYDDQRGPVALTVLLIVATLTATIFTAKASMS